jgi:hypothetical protein
MIVVEGMTVVVMVGIMIDRIVLLLKCISVVRLIVESIVEFIEFDVRSAKAIKKKKEISIKIDTLLSSDTKKGDLFNINTSNTKRVFISERK